MPKYLDYTYYPERRIFQIGDRVQVRDDWGWIGNPVGTIRGKPRECKVRLGVDYTYYVVFDEPAHDPDGQGPYRAAVILSGILSLLAPNETHEIMEA
jgi:hypothetical protein